MNTYKLMIDQIRRISSILLLLLTAFQIIIIILLEADIESCDLEDFHEIFGYIFLSLIVIHILSHWKRIESLFMFRKK